MLRRHAAALVSLGVTLAVAATIVFSQPIRSPWWIYADADATYTASSLELASNDHARYLDHPGLPIQETLAVAFDAEWVVAKAVDGTSHAQFMRDRLLNLDRTRGTFRTLAILFYLGGALLACWLVARMLRSWWWGMGAGVLWVGMPAGALDALQIRPETLLSLLCLVVMYLVTRASQERSARLFGLAGVALGFTVMVKLHALGLVVPLAIAALVAAPGEGWRADIAARGRELLRRRRTLIVALLVVWLALAARYTLPHWPFRSVSKGGAAFAVLLVVLLAAHAYVSLRAQRSESRRLKRTLDPFHSFVLGAILLGLALPISLVVDDGISALGSTRATLMGSGVNQGVKPFDLNGIDFGAWPLREALVVFAVAAVAAAYGLWKRELFPVLWFAGAAALGVMASARLGVTRYYAPPFVVSVPAALWLLKRFRLPGVVAAAGLALLVVVPQIQHRNGPADDAKKMEQIEASTAADGTRNAKVSPGRVALVVPDGWPSADALYFSVVQPYLSSRPVYPYAYLPDTPTALAYAGSHGIAAKHDVAFPLSGTIRLTIKLTATTR